MVIPSCVKNVVTKTSLDNNFIYGADSMWGRLGMVREEKIPYIPQDVSMLANTLEMYYKGLIESSGIKVQESLLKQSHSLSRLYDEIDNRIKEIIPNQSKSDRRNMKMFLNDLSALYIDARYENAQPSFQEFCDCYDFVKTQREFVIELLSGPKSYEPSANAIEKCEIENDEIC